MWKLLFIDNSWQGWADDLRTITDEGEVDVKAIRELLDTERLDEHEESER